jgi:type VI secretion system protein ImpE
MDAKELITAGRIADALKALQSEIREKPEDRKLRIFLFQLNCVIGNLEKAITQLQVIASLDADSMMMAQIFRPVIACELLRREVFAGKRTPLIFGEPAEWVGLLVQATGMLANGQLDGAAELRQRAFEAAPAVSGSINGQPFEWIADADSRLGPLLEMILDGKYYWVPFSRIARIEIDKPSDLRDLVWTPAQFVWANGGAVTGHIPVRYTGTENASDDMLKLARSTTWQELSPECFTGLGQRVIATDSVDQPILECRHIELKPVA